MKVAGFRLNGALRLGVAGGHDVIDLQAVDPRIPADLGTWLAANDGSLAPLLDLAGKAPATARHALDNVVFDFPVARPGKIVCLGLN